MDINYIIEQEPKIIDVLAYAEKNKEAHNIWKIYEYCKNMSYNLVGFGSKNESLKTNMAYDVFINELCDVLNV